MGWKKYFLLGEQGENNIKPINRNLKRLATKKPSICSPRVKTGYPPKYHTISHITEWKKSELRSKKA